MSGNAKERPLPAPGPEIGGCGHQTWHGVYKTFITQICSTFNPIKPGFLGLLIPEGGHIVPPSDFREKRFRWTINGFDLTVVIQSTRYYKKMG